jgi:hypothetical protein
MLKIKITKSAGGSTDLSPQTNENSPPPCPPQCDDDVTSHKASSVEGGNSGGGGGVGSTTPRKVDSDAWKTAPKGPAKKRY